MVAVLLIRAFSKQVFKLINQHNSHIFPKATCMPSYLYKVRNTSGTITTAAKLFFPKASICALNYMIMGAIFKMISNSCFKQRLTAFTNVFPIPLRLKAGSRQVFKFAFRLAVHVLVRNTRSGISDSDEGLTGCKVMHIAPLFRRTEGIDCITDLLSEDIF